MKNVLLLISLLVFIIACSDRNSVAESHAYSINTKKFGKQEIQIVYDNGRAVVTRSVSNLNGSEPLSQSVFIETGTDITIREDADGGILLSANAKDIWFIPFMKGSNPFRLEEGRCFKYYCTCGGAPNYDESNCRKNTSPSEITCSNAGECQVAGQLCLGHGAWINCGGPNQNLDDIHQNGYIGGVILTARTIELTGEIIQEVIVPDLYQNDDGTMMLYNDAVKAGLVR